MMQLFQGDFQKIAKACSQAPQEYHSVCFQSMGRDNGGTHAGDPRGAIAVCDLVKGQDRVDCLSGAIQDTFWDASGADLGLGFCRTLTSVQDKTMCYQMQFGRATQVYTSSSDIRAFCAKASQSISVSVSRIRRRAAHLSAVR